MSMMIKRDENGKLLESRGKIIEFYHDDFVKTLKQIGFDKNIPSLSDLNAELQKHIALSVILETIFVPFQMIDLSKYSSEDVLSKEGSEQGHQLRLAAFNHPTSQKIVKEGLRTCIENGIIWELIVMN